MAGTVMIVDDTSAMEVIEGVVSRMEDLSPAMKAIGEYVVLKTDERFTAQVSPDGLPWAQVRPATQARKKIGKILTESSRLRGSIVYRAGATSVEIGTNVIYAAVHQFGAQKGAFGTVQAQVKSHLRRTEKGEVHVKAHTRGMVIPWGDIPARPFLGASEADVSEFGRILLDYAVQGVEA